MGKFGESIKKIEEARRLTFPEFDRIVLKSAAVRVLAHLFLSPDCRANVDLAKFADKEQVKLSQISAHILTAAPSALAKYAQEHHKLIISQADILECFALDHARTIKMNQLDTKFSPAYALAHLLNISQVIKIKKVQGKIFVDLKRKFDTSQIVFKNVLVPDDLRVLKNQEVFHHSGVAVAVANTPTLIELADKIKLAQEKDEFIYEISQKAADEPR